MIDRRGILRGLRGFCEGFWQTIAAIFRLKIKRLAEPCDSCEGFPRTHMT